MDFWNKLNTFTDILACRYTTNQITQRNNITRRQLRNFMREILVQSQVTIKLKHRMAYRLQHMSNDTIPGDSIIHGRLHTKKRDAIMRALYKVDGNMKALWTTEEVSDIIATVKENQSDMNSLIKYLNS